MANRFNEIINYVKNNSCDNILEIGVLRGDTSILLIQNSKNKNVNYTGIDLFEDMTEEILEKEHALMPEPLNVVYKKLLTQSGRIDLRRGFSKDILPELFESGRKFDLIFIDGGHSLETIRTDFEYSIKLLNDDGVIFIDDYTDERSMRDVKRFCDNKMKAYDVIKKIGTEKDNYRGFDYRLVEVRLKPSTNKKISLINKISTEKFGIDVLTSLDKNFLSMFKDIFIPTLPPKTELYVKYIKGTVDERFTGFNIKKMPFIRDHIKQNKNLIFFCDADVVFFRDCNLFERLMQIYEKEGKPDLLMQWNQKEGFEKNMGVMLIKPGKRVYELYCKYCEATTDWIIENYCYGQNYFNHLIQTEFKDLVVKTLPIEFFGGQMKGVYELPVEPILYHATFEKDRVDKYEILNYFKTIHN